MYMFEKVCKDIEAGVIDSEKVLIWSIRALVYKKAEFDEHCEFSTTYLANMQNVVRKLSNDITLTALHYIFKKKRYVRKNLTFIRKDLDQRINEIQRTVEKAHIKIASAGSIKVKNKMSVFVDIQSNIVSDLVINARKNHTFKLVTTDVMFSEKSTEALKYLSKNKLKTDCYSYGSVGHALDVSDIVFVSCDVVDDFGAVMSSAMASAVAVAIAKEKPVYLCTSTLHYNPKVTPQDVSAEESHYYVPAATKIFDPDFDLVSLDSFTGVICEDGILKSEKFLSVSKEWLK
jgi:translation initiation factor 2B subunit (eIF-2B alpha/beta/delta family)